MALPIPVPTCLSVLCCLVDSDAAQLSALGPIRSMETVNAIIRLIAFLLILMVSADRGTFWSVQSCVNGAPSAQAHIDRERERPDLTLSDDTMLHTPMPALETPRL